MDSSYHYLVSLVRPKRDARYSSETKLPRREARPPASSDNRRRRATGPPTTARLPYRAPKISHQTTSIPYCAEGARGLLLEERHREAVDVQIRRQQAVNLGAAMCPVLQRLPLRALLLVTSSKPHVVRTGCETGRQVKRGATHGERSLTRCLASSAFREGH